ASEGGLVEALANRFLDHPLRGDANLLEELSQLHVKNVFVHRIFHSRQGASRTALVPQVGCASEAGMAHEGWPRARPPASCYFRTSCNTIWNSKSRSQNSKTRSRSCDTSPATTNSTSQKKLRAFRQRRNGSSRRSMPN